MFKNLILLLSLTLISSCFQGQSDDAYHEVADVREMLSDIDAARNLGDMQSGTNQAQSISAFLSKAEAEDWIEPNAATDAENQRYASCIASISAEIASLWDDPDLFIDASTLEIASFGDTEVVGFVSGGNSTRYGRFPDMRYAIELSNCERIFHVPLTEQLKVVFEGAADLEEINALYHNNEPPEATYGVNPATKQVYYYLEERPIEVTVSAATNESDCATAVEDQENTNLVIASCLFDPSQARVSKAYTSLTIYSLSNDAIAAYDKLPPEERLADQKITIGDRSFVKTSFVDTVQSSGVYLRENWDHIHIN